MEKQPNEITVCNLVVVLMPNGEIISLGKTIGWFKTYKYCLTPKINVVNRVTKVIHTDVDTHTVDK